MPSGKKRLRGNKLALKGQCQIYLLYSQNQPDYNEPLKREKNPQQQKYQNKTLSLLLDELQNLLNKVGMGRHEKIFILQLET